MNAADDARSRLDEVARRQEQAVAGAARGRHRGWDTAGLAAGWAGFAAMDLPLPETARLILFAVAALAALACFIRAGTRGRAVVHTSRLSGWYWALLGGMAVGSGAAVLGAVQLVDRLDLPVRNTILGGVLVAIVAGPVEWVHRAVLRRASA